MNAYTLKIDPAEDLLVQLQQSLKTHETIQVQLTAAQIRQLLPQVIHQVLSDKLVRSYIDGVFLKDIDIEIEDSNLSFSVEAVLDFVGQAAFLGRNKKAQIQGRIGMRGERAIIKVLDIDIPNLGFFQKGLFTTAKSSIIETVMKTDVEKTFTMALQKENIPIKATHLQIQTQSIHISVWRDRL